MNEGSHINYYQGCYSDNHYLDSKRCFIQCLASCQRTVSLHFLRHYGDKFTLASSCWNRVKWSLSNLWVADIINHTANSVDDEVAQLASFAAVASSLDKVLNQAVGVIDVFASLLNKSVGWAAGVIDTVASSLVASIRQKWSISKHRVGQVGWILKKKNHLKMRKSQQFWHC